MIPIWSEVSKALSSDIVSIKKKIGSTYMWHKLIISFCLQTFPDFSFASLPLSVDTWFKEAVQELILIESEWPVNAQ